MKIAYLISVYIHVLAAMAWIGGMMFMIFALIPAIKNNPDKAILIHKVGIKFRILGWVALIILLITGFYNLHVRGFGINDQFWSSYIGEIGIYKIILFMLILVLSLIHDFYIGTQAIKLWHEAGSQEKAIKFRMMARWMGRVNFLLALIALALGIIMVRGGI